MCTVGPLLVYVLNSYVHHTVHSHTPLRLIPYFNSSFELGGGVTGISLVAECVIGELEGVSLRGVAVDIGTEGLLLEK